MCVFREKKRHKVWKGRLMSDILLALVNRPRWNMHCLNKPPSRTCVGLIEIIALNLNLNGSIIIWQRTPPTKSDSTICTIQWMKPCIWQLWISHYGRNESETPTLTTFGLCRAEENLAKYVDQPKGDFSQLWPLLLTWFNFNPSMDK